MNGAGELVTSLFVLLPCLVDSVLLDAASDEMMANPAKARSTATNSVRHCHIIIDEVFFVTTRCWRWRGENMFAAVLLVL